MRRARFAVLLAPLLVVGGCSGVSDPAPIGPITPGQAFTLKVGQKAEISGSPGEDNVVVEFAGVPQDSRCPTDVDCVWAGDAIVHAYVDGRGAREEIRLHVTEEPRAATAKGYRFQLLELAPLPTSDRRIPPAEYAATLLAHPAT